MEREEANTDDGEGGGRLTQGMEREEGGRLTQDGEEGRREGG